jgi:hypothetical protein
VRILRRQLRKLPNRAKTTLVTILLLSVAGIGVIASSHWRNGITSGSAEAKAFTPEQRPQQHPLEAERISLRPTGFEPPVITRPAGRFLLAINDRSGDSDTQITFARETGERLHTIRMRDTARKHEWRKVIDVPPGRYVISEANHPEWTCSIVLTPN